jgi:DUF1680 family protein
MVVRLTAADQRIDAVRGCAAIERGPVLYAVERDDADDLRLDALVGAGLTAASGRRGCGCRTGGPDG